MDLAPMVASHACLSGHSRAAKPSSNGMDNYSSHVIQQHSKSSVFIWRAVITDGY